MQASTPRSVSERSERPDPRAGRRAARQQSEPEPRPAWPGNATIGVLALQGAFGAHVALLRGLADDRLGRVVEVRTAHDLVGVDALVMPGGESTTMSKLLTSSGLFDPLAERIADGMPVFGTCAGLILLADRVVDGRPDQRTFAALDVTVQRNGYGRQLQSFEADLDEFDPPLHGIFIRAPRIVECGPSVEVLARHADEAVLVRQGNVLAATFHPELTADARLHTVFVDVVAASRSTPLTKATDV